MRAVDKRDIASQFADSTAVQKAMARGVRDALLRHKRLGEPIFVWEDGRVVRIPPEEIPEDGQSWPPED